MIDFACLARLCPIFSSRDMDAPSCSEAYAHLHFVVRPLHFAAQDLVYGASAGGRLRALQQRAGGRLLTDIARPMGLTTEAFSLKVLDQAVKEGHTIQFDLTPFLLVRRTGTYSVPN